MTFKNAVEKTLGLENTYKRGLEALRARDKSHIKAEDTRNLRGSVDIDAAVKKSEPHANRWDFAIAYKHNDRTKDVIYWVELHTASDSQIKAVIRKAVWLQNWLKNIGKLLSKFECDIVWVSSGATSFTLSAPQRKQMAQVGLQTRGGMLRILDKRGG